MKVSIVVPAFNEEQYIEKCLKSISKQTLSRRDYEIILVDGGSKDKTLKIAKKYADKILKNKKPIGAARQAGLKAAKAPVVAFIDADKENYAVYFEKSLQLLRSGGLIAIDNTFMDGRVLQPGAKDVPGKAIREFNEHLFHDKRVMVSLLPIGDGLTLAFKK